MSGSNLELLIENGENEEELTHRVLFLAEQLKLLNMESTGHRYSGMPISFRSAISLFLRSRNCYNELRKSLGLLHPHTIKTMYLQSHIYFMTQGIFLKIYETIGSLRR